MEEQDVRANRARVVDPLDDAEALRRAKGLLRDLECARVASHEEEHAQVGVASARLERLRGLGDRDPGLEVVHAAVVAGEVASGADRNVRLRLDVLQRELLRDHQSNAPELDRPRVACEREMPGHAAQHSRLRGRRELVRHQLDGAVEAGECGLVVAHLPEDLAQVHLCVSRRGVVAQREQALGRLGQEVGPAQVGPGAGATAREQEVRTLGVVRRPEGQRLPEEATRGAVGAEAQGPLARVSQRKARVRRQHRRGVLVRRVLERSDEMVREEIRMILGATERLGSTRLRRGAGSDGEHAGSGHRRDPGRARA